MRIESTSFTDDDLRAFLDEVVAFERARPDDGRSLAERLEVAEARLDRLVALLPDVPAESAGGGWSAKEVLVHIGVICGLYGWMAEAIAREEGSRFDLLSFFRLRDVAAAQRLALSIGELMDILHAELSRAAEFLRTCDPGDLRRRVPVGPFELSAEEVARLGLCAHVESHVQQFEIAAFRTSHHPQVA